LINPPRKLLTTSSEIALFKFMLPSLHQIPFKLLALLSYNKYLKWSPK
jgi:hypothetical protein